MEPASRAGESALAALGEDFLDDFAGGEEFVDAPLVRGRPPDLAVDAARGELCLDRFGVVVLIVTEGDHVRIDLLDRDEDVRGVTEPRVINRVQRRHHLDALGSGDDGIRFVGHVRLPCDDHVERVAHRPGVLQVVDVARVQNIERPLCDHAAHRSSPPSRSPAGRCR